MVDANDANTQGVIESALAVLRRERDGLRAQIAPIMAAIERKEATIAALEGDLKARHDGPQVAPIRLLHGGRVIENERPTALSQKEAVKRVLSGADGPLDASEILARSEAEYGVKSDSKTPLKVLDNQLWLLRKEGAIIENVGTRRYVWRGTRPQEGGK